MDKRSIILSEYQEKIKKISLTQVLSCLPHSCILAQVVSFSITVHIYSNCHQKVAHFLLKILILGSIEIKKNEPYKHKKSVTYSTVT